MTDVIVNDVRLCKYNILKFKFRLFSFNVLVPVLFNDSIVSDNTYSHHICIIFLYYYF